MSRAYKLKVSERARHVLRARDHVSTHLELLEILPGERMADLLAAELVQRGFQRDGAKLTRREADGIVIEIDPAATTVTVKIEAERAVVLEGEKQRLTESPEDKQRQHEREKLRAELLQDLQKQADAQKVELQKKLTDQLEGRLLDLRKELDQVVNRVTAGALKEKAAQIGQIKEISEDASGSLTIVLEV